MLYDTSATTAELEAAQIEIALLPVGAIEQHSIHLPLGTDWLAAQAVARRVGELLAGERDVYLLPALPFSLSECHGPMPGTVWLKPQTLADILHEVACSLLDQGVCCLVVINGHGGNFVLDDEIQELNLDHPEMIVLGAASWDGGGGPRGRVTGGDIHAGAGETSTMLYLTPEHVRPERADYTPPVGREYLDYATMAQISPSGAWGRPAEGTGEVGKRALEEVAAALARAILRARDEIVALRGLDRRTPPGRRNP